tara:strand:+ start:1547 stop:1753 length:207 start_codon:yes stop_codon:yes gene_type:complete
MKETKGENNTMNTLFSIITVLAAIFAVGSIEDCGGHCLGNDNWTMFFAMSTIMLISAFLTIYTMKGNK